MVVASVAPAEADADSNRPASGSPVFFPGHIFFIHYREVEGLAGDVTANLYFCQHVGFAPGDTVHPLLALLVCFDGEGVFIEAGQRQLVGNVARDPDQYFTDPVLGYFFVCGITVRASPGKRRNTQLSSLASRKSPVALVLLGRNALT